jgi:NADH-quinone oxidoreductase subunit C
MVEENLTSAVQTRLQGKILESHTLRGEEIIFLSRQGMLETFRILKEDPQLDFNFLMDITAVDYLGKKTPRFEVVYQMYSLSHNRGLRVKVALGEEELEVPSLTSLWKSADWLEREAWDMFGVRFQGHPDLRRILLYDEFQGHPLRKDYPVNQCQPRVPEREVVGTFVDDASKNKLLHLKQKFSSKK